MSTQAAVLRTMSAVAAELEAEGAEIIGGGIGGISPPSHLHVRAMRNPKILTQRRPTAHAPSSGQCRAAARVGSGAGSRRSLSACVVMRGDTAGGKRTGVQRDLIHRAGQVVQIEPAAQIDPRCAVI